MGDNWYFWFENPTTFDMICKSFEFISHVFLSIVNFKLSTISQILDSWKEKPFVSKNM